MITNGLSAVAVLANAVAVSQSQPVPLVAPAVPVKSPTVHAYCPPPCQTFVPLMARIPGAPPTAWMPPLWITTDPCPPATTMFAAPLSVALLLTIKSFWNVAEPPRTRLNVAALLPSPTAKSAPLLTTALPTVSVPLFSANAPPLLTRRFVAATLPPASASVPLSTTTLPSELPVPVSVQVPAPSLLSVPLPLIAPAKFVLAAFTPTCTRLPFTVTRPAPVSASTDPAVAKFSVLLLLTRTATVPGSAAALAQLNTPPPLTVRFVLASVPLTVSVPPPTRVAPL